MAAFNLQIPPMSSSLWKSEEGRRQISAYLCELNEQLRYLFSHIETTNFTADTRALVTSAAETADKAQKLSELLEQGLTSTNSEVLRTYEELYAQIVESAQEVTRSCSAELTREIDSLQTRVSEEYTARSETAALRDTLTSSIEQTSDEVALRFSQATDYTAEVGGALEDYKQHMESFIRFSADGVEIGAVDSDFLARLTSTRLSFLQNGAEIAYVSQNRLYITDAACTGAVSLERPGLGAFAFSVEPNGSLSLTKR